jgi:hypothetical protein
VNDIKYLEIYTRKYGKRVTNKYLKIRKNKETKMGKYNWDNLKNNLQKGVGDKTNKDFNDPREWKLQRDENDSGTAVIRLLPGKGGTTPPVVRIYEHSTRIFNKASNKYRYYIEPSPASIEEDCPVSDIWYELGDIGTDEALKMQKTFSRSVKFISNVLVVNDPANPENNGKVFYWKYGVKLFEKFQAALEPTQAQLDVGKKPIQLFDPEEGANIILESARVGGFVNYDGTTIMDPSAAFESEEEMDDAILEKCIDLTEFISEDYYKPYAELKKKIAWVLEKSPEEAYLISHGSKVITEPYTKGGGSSRGETPAPKTDTAVPDMGGSYTPKTKKAPVVDQEVEDAVDEVVEEVKAEPAKAKATPKPAPKKAPVKKAPEGDDDILAMLDDL